MSSWSSETPPSDDASWHFAGACDLDLDLDLDLAPHPPSTSLQPSSDDGMAAFYAERGPKERRPSAMLCNRGRWTDKSHCAASALKGGMPMPDGTLGVCMHAGPESKPRAMQRSQIQAMGAAAPLRRRMWQGVNPTPLPGREAPMTTSPHLGSTSTPSHRYDDARCAQVEFSCECGALKHAAAGRPSGSHESCNKRSTNTGGKEQTPVPKLCPEVDKT